MVSHVGLIVNVVADTLPGREIRISDLSREVRHRSSVIIVNGIVIKNRHGITANLKGF